MQQLYATAIENDTDTEATSIHLAIGIKNLQATKYHQIQSTSVLATVD